MTEKNSAICGSDNSDKTMHCRLPTNSGLKTISFIVPCHNEQANVEPLLAALDNSWVALRSQFPEVLSREVVLVDDGSTDGTWERIAASVSVRCEVIGIRLTRNFGHQSALQAGLLAATGDALISLDADLQDDIGVIPRMVEAHIGGDEIVFGVRDDRSSDTFFKRMTAMIYYRFLEVLGVEVVLNHGDFRLMGRKSTEALRQYGERNLYLRGLIRSFGFRNSTVTYARGPRLRGESTYSLRRMILLALDGITSFSVRPLRFIFFLGFLISIFSFFYTVYAVAMAMIGATVSGWASLIVSIYLIGGIQIMGIGILGEYIGRIYIETKRRPNFLIEEVIKHGSAKE